MESPSFGSVCTGETIFPERGRGEENYFTVESVFAPS
jgi:hypothetical protein